MGMIAHDTRLFGDRVMQAVTDVMSRKDPSSDYEERVVLHNVSWETYERLLEALGDDHPSLRLTYLEGLLEVMATSPRHEQIKKMIARLIELWALQRKIRFDGYGGATFRKKDAARGLEADECYFLGEFGPAPDLAIEVVESHGVVDKMSVYAGLGVREVWVWENDALTIHVLWGDRYVVSKTSRLLPALDVAELAEFVRQGEQDQSGTVLRYWDRLREGG